MSHSILATVLAAFSAAATSLEEAQAWMGIRHAAAVDPYDLPEYLQRDIGLDDVRIFGAEGAGPAGRVSQWTDHIQTRQAS